MRPRSDDEKIRLTAILRANPTPKGPIYDRWLVKYGKEEADRRLAQKKVRQSAASSGSNNPMYGKPTPIGSGNGWSGWYKGWYFRSLRELSFVVDLDMNGIPWSSADTAKYRIPYIDYNGSKRTYTPDFVVGSSVVEIKPIKLHNTATNTRKRLAAEEFCANIGMTYIIVDAKMMSDDDIFEFVTTGRVILLPRYKERFDKIYESNTYSRNRLIGQVDMGT